MKDFLKQVGHNKCSLSHFFNYTIGGEPESHTFLTIQYMAPAQESLAFLDSGMKRGNKCRNYVDFVDLP